MTPYIWQLDWLTHFQSVQALHLEDNAIHVATGLPYSRYAKLRRTVIHVRQVPGTLCQHVLSSDVSYAHFHAILLISSEVDSDECINC